MKVLILSITAGQGHNSTAKALQGYLQKLGAEADILDTFNYISRLLGDTVSQGYLLSVSKAKAAYAAVYKSLEKRKTNAYKLSATRLNNLLWTKKVRHYIRDYAPDAIVCTHPFPAIIVDIMKQKGTLNAVTMGIVTDFCMHPYWEEALRMDYLVIASEGLIPQAKKKGYRDEQILPLGIPINPKFSVRGDKQALCAEFGLEPGKFTLLLMSGSMGYGNIESLVEQLDAMPYDFQMITVCGNNQEIKEAIDALHTRKKVVNFGFTDRVSDLMDLSDCIVGKPGGLTSSEALAKGMPMILVNPIPGQEERNVDFLLNSGAAMATSDTNTLDNVLYELMSAPEKLELMRRSAELIGKPHSTRDICEFIVRECAPRA